MTSPKRFDRSEAADEGFLDRRDRGRAQKGVAPGPALAPLAAGRNAAPPAPLRLTSYLTTSYHSCGFWIAIFFATY